MRISDNVASNWQPHYLGVAALDELDALFRSLAERGALLMIGLILSRTTEFVGKKSYTNTVQ